MILKKMFAPLPHKGYLSEHPTSPGTYTIHIHGYNFCVYLTDTKNIYIYIIGINLITILPKYNLFGLNVK
jgi:hypothetical protein